MAWRVGFMLAVLCGNINAQTTSTGGSNVESSYKVVSCAKDSQSLPVSVAGLAPVVD